MNDEQKNLESDEAIAKSDLSSKLGRQKPADLKNVICPQCGKPFQLTWNDYSFGDKKQTLYLRGCPSGGIYDVSIHCPHCDYEEEL